MHNAVAACAFASLRESSFRKPYFSFKVRETCLSLLRKKVPAFAFVEHLGTQVSGRSAACNTQGRIR